MATVHTFGDSILDCGRYNDHGVTPAGLLARNDDALFPAFHRRDLETILGHPVQVVARATDGATVADLPRQLRGHRPPAGAITLLTIGGNDLLQGQHTDGSTLLRQFATALREALTQVAHTQLFVGNVYDPSFGHDERNFLDIDPAVARRAHAAVNDILASETARVGGTLVDLHAHFLGGDETWFTRTIEPSLTGASEVRRAFLAAWEASRGAAASS
jgi:hypothetical protein